MHVRIQPLILLVLTLAGAVCHAAATCPSVAACHQEDVPCNTPATVLDSNFDADPLEFPNITDWCHLVNCSGRRAELQGEIPCDLPVNTTFLFLADIGMSGSFSFLTLQQRAPALFCSSGSCPWWTGVVDMSGNNISAIEQLEAPEFFWGYYRLNAGLDLSSNTITTLSRDSFAYATLYGSLVLSENKITLVDAKAFYQTVVDPDLLLRGNAIASVEPFAFFHTTVNGNLDLSGNSIQQIKAYTFRRASVTGMIALNNNIIGTLQGQTFVGMKARGLLLQHNQLSSLGNLWFTGASFFFINLSYNNMTHIAGGMFSNATRAIIGGAFLNMSVGLLNLSHNQLSAVDAGTFAGMQVNSGIDLSHNCIDVLEDKWYDYIPLSVELNMAGNPTQCSIGRLPDTQYGFSCTCANDSRSDLLGNGAYCSRQPCPAPDPGLVPYSKLRCPDMHSNSFPSGSECKVACHDGYQLFNASQPAIVCLGGVWGLRPNLAATYPSCYPASPGFLAWQVAVGAVGSCIGSLLIMGVIYKIRTDSKRIRKQEYDIELKQHLLSEQNQQLDELRQMFTITANEVQLEARIDSGAFGEVWRGRWNDLTVAIKRMRAVLLALDERFASEFEAETTLMRRLRHPNVVTFFGAGTDHDGMPFLVCELMDTSLQRLLWWEDSAAGPISMRQKVKWAHDAASGMAFLHGKSLIHRDLKSGNLLGGFQQSFHK